MNVFEDNRFGEIFSKAYQYEKIPLWKGSPYQQISVRNVIKDLYTEGRYEDCIKLIESVQMYYTDKICVEYLMKSLISKNDFTSANYTMNLYLNSQNSNKEEDVRWCNSIFNAVKDKEYMGGSLSHQVLPSQNPYFPNISDKTEISYNSADGCKMIARSKINVGEIILLEKPFASVGFSKCANCLSDSFFKVPCTYCYKVYYCSKQCFDDNSKNHSWKCYSMCYKKYEDTTILALQIFLDALNTDWKPLSFIDCIDPQNDLENLLLLSDFVDFKNCMDLLNNQVKECCELVNIICSSNSWNRVKTKLIELKIPDDDIVKQVGQILLRILIVCNFKSMQTFDDIMGIKTELYPSLSLLQISCQPNTIICTQGDAIILKALKDIPAGASICHNNFEMINTRYSKVFCQKESRDLFYSKCIHSCRCDKDLHKILNMNNKSIGNITSKVSSNIFFVYLEQMTSEIIKGLKYPYMWNMNEAIDIMNKIGVDRNNLVFQMVYFEVLSYELSSAKLDNLEKYLPIVMNIDNIHYFKRNHIKLFMLLQNQIPSFLFSADLSKSLCNTLISYMEFLEKYVYLFYPNEMLLEQVEKMKRVWRLQFPNDGNLKADEA